MVPRVGLRSAGAFAFITLLAIVLVGCGDATGGGTTGQDPDGSLPGGSVLPPAGVVTTQPSTPDPTPVATVTPAPPAPEVLEFYEDFVSRSGLVLDRPPEEADVTGDGHPEVLLHAQGRDCAGCAVKTFFVMSGRDAIFDALGEGWLAPRAAGSGFDRFSPVSIPGEGACCPSWFAVETYLWAGADFEAEVPIRLEHFLEVNQYPITAPLEPLEQVATVALHYDLVLKRQDHKAYALLSGQYQASTSFDDWRAAFPRDATLFLQAIETGDDANEVSVRLEAIDIASGQAGDRGTYEGAWTLVEENGVWKLDMATVEFIAP